MFQNLIDIIAAPPAAFARLREKPTILLPLLLVLISSASVQAGYIALTDRGFLVDQQLDQISAMLSQLSSAQLADMREQMMAQGTTGMIIQSALSTAVIVCIVMALYALYLRFVSRFSFDELGWKHWFSLVSWTAIPTVFGALASWAALLSNSNGQLPLTELNPLNFANLLGLPQSGPLALLSPLYIWSFVLLALGFQHWTKKSLLASALISLAPYLLIFGIWAIF